METISRSLLTFLLNALWQVPLAAGVAALACRWMRNGPASHRHAVWVAALVAAVLLPFASTRPRTSPSLPTYDPSLATTAAVIAHSAPAAASHTAVTAPPSRNISLAVTTATFLLAVYFLFVFFRAAQLAWASLRTVQLRNHALLIDIPERLRRVWCRCQDSLGVMDVELVLSSRVTGPVNAGRSIILPASLLDEPSEDVLTTAVGHEMAHVARRDFACNVLYELLLLPVSFHPAAWVIRRGIESTREMSCDELVTRRLMDAGVYARSILSIAASMTALPSPGYALGVFDGDILEERIRRLVERPVENLKRARLLLAGGLGALALCCALASSVAVSALAQEDSSPLYKNAEATYQGRDYPAAASQAENLVRLEPENLKAKFLLSHALLQQYTPGMDPDNPFVTGARQQFLDVLARDPRNLQALAEMMSLETNTKRFDSARQWALKTIQVDPRNEFAYYTIGFIDWVVSYPDYGKARSAAGMKQADPGIIPDPALRHAFGAQHAAHLDEGFAVLQVAIEIDPNFSDAMAYMNLLYRIQAATSDTPEQYTDLTAKADYWVVKALEAKRNRRLNPGPEMMEWVVAPPPPPPPPPPPGK